MGPWEELGPPSPGAAGDTRTPAHQPQEAPVVTADSAALTALRYGWGEAYEIDVDAEGTWRARRRDGLGDAITEGDPEALAAAIFADYSLKPVPRDPSARLER